MGKDKHGNYIPPKGKPSSTEKGQPKIAFAVNDPEKEEELTDKYTEGPEEEPAEGVPTRHPNRNVNKGQEEDEDNT